MFGTLRMTLGLRTKVLLATATLTLALLGTAAWAVHAQESTATPEPEAQPASTQQEQVQASASQRSDAVYRQTVRVFLHADSVRPRLIHLSPGPVTFRAENETGADAALVVERVAAGQSSHRAARVVAEREKKRGHGELELGVGEYVFYEESRPQLRGTLVVAPREQ